MRRADVVSVQSLFSGSARYRCGPARPGYHWGPPQVAQLVIDIENGAHDSHDEEDVSEERLYLGVVTVSPPKSGLYTILDGQQRMVTLTMFLAFARDRMPTNRERNAIDRVLVRRAFRRDPEPRLRLTPEDHAWFSHFILPPGATKRLPATAPLGSPRELLLAARFMEHVFSGYSDAEVRSMVDFLLHHTALVRSLSEPQPQVVAPNAPSLPASANPASAWNDNDPVPQPAYVPAARYRVAAE